jgi:4-amino-4-deoxy-L-arabinose transferase-like glycosyltransferase
MAGFWIALDGPPARRSVAGFAFFVGLSIGMMAKGPIALVLTFIPIGAWTVWTRSWRAVWTGLPWLAGSVLAAVLVVPWYWAAERASPGFLNYFLLGEHWKRFVESGWKGDLYGVAHARPRGLIWLFWIAAVLPWSLLAIGWLARAALFRRDELRTLVGDPWQSYLLLWVIAPMLFFTLSGNILATYVLPGLPAFALLLAVLWRPVDDEVRALRPPVRLAIAAGIVLSCVFVWAILAMRPRFENEFSQKALVYAYEAQRDHPGERLIYFGPAPSSAEFYTQGKVIMVRDTAALLPYLADSDADFIAMRGQTLASLPVEVRSRLSPVGRFGEYQLLREVTTILK